MALQLSNFQDKFGTTHSAAYALITRQAADVPHSGVTITFVSIFVDSAAEAAGFEPLEIRREELTFNPYADGVVVTAYTELSNLGGIYDGSIIVP